jgi:PIN domain nuclease of toxin-antitoxin system
VRILLDTHAFLWFYNGDSRLSSYAREEIESSANQNLVSIVSLWEIAIKVSLRKLTLTKPYEQAMAEAMAASAASLLPLQPDHLSGVVDIPFHHGDPLIAPWWLRQLQKGLPL